MKAAYIEKFGGPQVLTYGDLPDPVAGPGQVVVDTVAASVNGADPKVRRRRIQADQVSAGPGRRFLGHGQRRWRGCHRSQRRRRGVRRAPRPAATAPIAKRSPSARRSLRKKPAGLSHVDAAALALTGLTAICAVEETLKLKRRRDHPDPRRRWRRGELRHPARQASRRAGHLHRQHGQRRLRARTWCRPSHRLQHD